ncbi:MAG: hypothetical protein OXC80_12145 [Gammaproteobacteria bacterium]|nr:hypothetical protein [Gammaproteobacteria bacterium]
MTYTILVLGRDTGNHALRRTLDRDYRESAQQDLSYRKGVHRHLRLASPDGTKTVVALRIDQDLAELQTRKYSVATSPNNAPSFTLHPSKPHIGLFSM